MKGDLFMMEMILRFSLSSFDIFIVFFIVGIVDFFIFCMFVYVNLFLVVCFFDKFFIEENFSSEVVLYILNKIVKKF